MTTESFSPSTADKRVSGLAFVDSVRVRWSYTSWSQKGCTWLCDVHGVMPVVGCEHALAASLAFAEELLGVRATSDPHALLAELRITTEEQETHA